MAAKGSALKFWGSSLLVAVAFSALVPVVLPLSNLGLESEADLERGWLLSVFCAGVFAILFGASGLISGSRWLTVRDVEDAGSIPAAVERARLAKRAHRGEGLHNAGVWTIATGCFLVAIYFVLWQALGS